MHCGDCGLTVYLYANHLMAYHVGNYTEMYLRKTSE